MKALIVTLSVAALLSSSAALARKDEDLFKLKAQTLQAGRDSKEQEALPKLHAEEAALLKHLAEVRQAMQKAVATS